MGRVADRASFDSDVRMSLAEGDLDRMDAVLGELNDRMGKVLWAMVGLLISVATTCIVILITAGVGR